MAKDSEPRSEGLLKGKVAIVTGGASGIGKAIALEYVQQGAKVAVFDINPESPEEFENLGIAYYSVDVVDSQHVYRCIDDVERTLGPISTLVNNAAVDPKDSLVGNTSPETWDRVLAVNLKAPAYLTKVIANAMYLRGIKGSIIFISSIHTAQAFEGDAPYDASKTGLIGLMRNAALEYGKYGIRVNAIAPGLINGTGMSNVEGKLLEEAENATPLRLAGTPQDIANWAAFLASDKASFTTGQEIRVDGGVSIKSPLPF